MKNSAPTVYLTVAGLLLLVVGGAILLAPHAFYGSNGIVLGNNPDLLSEIRAPGGLLASSGVFALMSVFRRHLRLIAVQLTVLVYGTFGLARLVSMVQDGTPSTSIVGATILELLIALIGIAMLLRYRPAPASEITVSSAAR